MTTPAAGPSKKSLMAAGAQNRRKCRRQAKQDPSRQRNDCGGQQGAGAEDEANQLPVAPHLREVHADGIGEQHQHEPERGDGLQDLRVQVEMNEPKTKRSDHETEQEKQRDLRKPRALDQAGEQRGNEDDNADQGEGRDAHPWIPAPANCFTRSPSTAFASPKSIQVLSCTYSSLSMPAKPGFLLRFTASTVFALSASMMGIP